MTVLVPTDIETRGESLLRIADGWDGPGSKAPDRWTGLRPPISFGYSLTWWAGRLAALLISASLAGAVLAHTPADPLTIAGDSDD